jgi:hypothetical protein
VTVSLREEVSLVVVTLEYRLVPFLAAAVTAYARFYMEFPHKANNYIPTHGQTLLLFKNPRLNIIIGTDLCT